MRSNLTQSDGCTSAGSSLATTPATPAWPQPQTPAWPQHTSSSEGLYTNSSAGLYATSSVGLYPASSVEAPITPAGGAGEASIVALDYASVLRLLVRAIAGKHTTMEYMFAEQK